MLFTKSLYFQENPPLQHQRPSLNLPLSNFLKIYLDFCYYLCFSPFHLTFDKSSNRFIIRQWFPQKLLCVLCSTLCFFWLLICVISVFPNFTNSQNSRPNPSLYFNICSSGIGLILKTCIVKRFWLNQADFLRLANYFAQETPNTPIFFSNGQSQSDGRFITSALSVRLLYSLYVSVMLMTVVTGIGLYNGTTDHISGWSLKWLANRLLKGTYEAYLFSSKFNETQAFDFTVDYFLLGLGAVGFLQRHLMGFFGDLFLLIFTLTLWTPTYLFARRLGMNNREEEDEEETKNGKGSHFIKWSTVRLHYQAIQKLTKLVSKVAGPVVTCLLLEVVLFYSTSLDDVFGERVVAVKGLGWNKVVRMAFFVGSTSSILFLSANTCYQMNSVKIWISSKKNREGMQMDEVFIVLDDLSTHVIGMKASEVFTITYGVVANVVGITVTYFIICIQA